MPSEGTKRQSFRLDQELWDEFGAATARAVPPADRTEVLKQFIRWYLHERGVTCPKRPAKVQPDADMPERPATE